MNSPFVMVQIPRNSSTLGHQQCPGGCHFLAGNPEQFAECRAGNLGKFLCFAIDFHSIPMIFPWISIPNIPNPEFVMKSWNSCFIADCLIRGIWFSGIFRQMSWASEMGFWMPRSFRLGVRWAWGMELTRLPFFDGNPLERWTSAKFVAFLK